jgi:hypothetical protein
MAQIITERDKSVVHWCETNLFLSCTCTVHTYFQSDLKATCTSLECFNHKMLITSDNSLDSLVRLLSGSFLAALQR